MNKFCKKLSIIFVMAFTIMLGCFSNVFAADDGIVGTVNLNNTIENSAKIGDKLSQPEKAWKRYDDSDSRFIYDTCGQHIGNTYYGGSEHWSGNKNFTVNFKFYGSKIRIISSLTHIRNTSLQIMIDGVKYSFSEAFGTTDADQILTYEKLDLVLGIHEVKLFTNVETDMTFDAIDIDSNGYLVDPSANLAKGISLSKSTDSLQVGQTDQLTATITPDNATNKTVTWKSSDKSIATVDSTGKVTAVKEGTAMITATTTDGSNLSASCTVNVTSQGTTPTNPTDNSGNAILTITMTNGMEKEYDLSMTDVNAFANWYNGRAAGTGNVYYTFNKNASLAAFTKRTEYILYDKILEFNVDQYTK